ncbi:MAG: hypothetical protein M1829_006140 [Trizodia sp. TS-e1964]|nr:MAG: hypothetical protein M1829_006140 [Trizodia sp. TS-e1964]
MKFLNLVWAALAFIVAIAASPLQKRASSILVGYRTVSAEQALIYKNAGGTLVWSAPRSSQQIGPGTYLSPTLGDWPGAGTSWYCAILADSGPWNLANKAWVPQTDGCKPLWWAQGVPNIPAYLTSVGGPGFALDNTVLLSQISGFQKLQLTIPQQLHGASGGLNLVAQCAAISDTAGVEALKAYGSADWASWPNVKGTVQTV